MAGMIRNIKDFDKYIISVVYNGMEFRTAKRSYLRNMDFVKERKEILIYIMITQWMKREVKEFLLEDKNREYLRRVKTLGENDSKWHWYLYDHGERFFDFDTEITYPDFYDDIAKIRDFLYGYCEDFLDNAIANNELIFNKLKKEPKFSTFEKTLKLANEWHKETFYKALENASNEAIDYGGTEDVIKFKNGYKIVKLNTPEALDAEGEMMGHSAGEGAYDKGVVDGSVQLYSLRDDIGRARVTMEVRNKKVYQCKGKGDMPPAKEDVLYIQAFVNYKKLVPQFDVRNMGLVKGINRMYYNIYRLPQNFECENLDLRGLDLSGFVMPLLLKARVVNISGAYNLPSFLDFSSCGELIFTKHHFSVVDEIIFPAGQKIEFHGESNLPKIIDLSACGSVDFSGSNLKGVELIRFPHGKKVVLSEVDNLPSKLNFSKCGYVDLSWNDLKDVKEITFAEKGDINLSKAKNLKDKVDFSRAGNIDLSYVDFSRTSEIVFPKEYKVNLSKAIALPEELDFGQCGDIDLSGCNFSRVKKITFPKRHNVDLSNTKHLPYDLNLKNCASVTFQGADLGNVKDITLPIDGDVNFSNAADLPQYLNLSQVRVADFSNANLNSVKEMIVPSDNPSFVIKGTNNFPVSRVKPVKTAEGASIKRGFFAKLFG